MTKSVLTASAALAAYDEAIATQCGDMRVIADGLAWALRDKVTPKARAAKDPVTEPDIVNAQNLLAAVARLCDVMEHKNTIPILSNIRLLSSKGELVLFATNLDHEATITLRESDLPEFDVTVGGRRLLKTLQKTRGGVAMTLANDKLAISVGGATTTLPILPSIDLPAFADLDKFKARHAATFSISSTMFRDIFGFVLPYISTEETRYYLNGAYVHGTADPKGGVAMTAVATDGHRMAKQTFHLANVAGNADALAGILPRSAVAWLIKHLPKDQPIQITYGEDMVRVTAHGLVYKTKLLDGSFPDYNRVIPKGEAQFKLVPKQTGLLVEQIEGLRRLSAEKSTAIKIVVDEGAVIGKVRDMEGVESTVELACRFIGDPLLLGINSRYLIQALTSSDGAVLEFSGHDTVIKDDDPAHVVDRKRREAREVSQPIRVIYEREDRIGVLMPLRP